MHLLTAFAVLSIGLAACVPSAAARSRAGGLLAAAGKVDITPERPAYIAGYEGDRRSVGAHDRLMARCLVLERAGVRIAFVSCDLLGMPRYEAARIRAHVTSVPPEHVYLSATHTHSGPDILGMWGPGLTVSGVDQAWMATMRDRVARLVNETAGHLRPAAVRFANTTDVPRISKNVRVAQILDTELAVLQAVDRVSGKPIATLVNYACHPEIMHNRLMTADFPHWLYEKVESAGGGVCLYINGAQGGMVTADFDESSAPPGENWKAAETIGTGMGARALEIISGQPLVDDPVITAERRMFTVPLENQRYRALIKLHVFPGDVVKNGVIETEVNRITIGPAELLTLPGEVLPNVGFYLKSVMRGHPKFLLGLTCDFLGYILAREDYGLQLYGYETSQSVGRRIEPLMVKNLEAMMPGAEP